MFDFVVYEGQTFVRFPMIAKLAPVPMNAVIKGAAKRAARQCAACI